MVVGVDTVTADGTRWDRYARADLTDRLLANAGKGLRRTQRTALLASVTGLVTGLGVAGFEWLAGSTLLTRVERAPLWMQLTLPGIGLVVTALALRWAAAGATPSTSEEYIRSFHERDRRLDLRPVLGRLMASAATLGSGAAMGFEGPAIYLGAAVGSGLQRRLSRWFSRDDAKVLLVAGAAAGVAAIFKAPATGVVFALEVPYQDDLARRMLLPALFSAASGYVVYAAFNGTTPLFPITGSPPFGFVDLGVAALLGLTCGLGARAFASLIRRAKAISSGHHPVLRIAGAGASIAGLIALGRLGTGRSLVLGSGYPAIAWALQPHHALWIILWLFVLRALATATAVAGGGAGGLFVPLVVQGALLGAAAAGLFHVADTPLFPVLGVAAFLGAGYRVPLAAVMFVAETTGRPGFVVPGLIAAASAQLVMGRASVSTYQRAARTGILEQRISLPVTSVLRTDAATVPPDATLQEVFSHHIVSVRLLVVPVVSGNHYLGMLHLHDIVAVDRERWDTTSVAHVMRTDEPVGDVTWTLGQTLAALEEADVDRMAITNHDAFVGVVTTGELLKLDEILEQTSPPTTS